MIAFLLLSSLLVLLLYFFVQNLGLMVSQKSKTAQSHVRLERGQYIPVSVTKLKHLLQSLHSASADSLDSLFDKLEAVIDFQYSTLSSKLQNYFESFDPMTDPSELSHMSSTQIAELEDKFLDDFRIMMKKANYELVTQDMLDFALNEDFLNTLPIECAWDRLDSNLFSTYAAKHKENDKGSEYGDKIWIFYRGIGVETATDTFLLQKMDILIVQGLSALWKFISPFFTRVSASNTMPFRQPEAPVDEANSIMRKSLKAEIQKYGFKSLNMKTTLQEPTFKELVIVYRVAKPKNQRDEALRQLVVENAQTVKNPNGIFLKSFRDVPMADLELVFPEKSVHMKPADILKFSLAGIVGLVSAIVQVGLEPSFYVTLSTFGVFIGMVIKFFYDYQAWMLYYENSLNRVLYDKSVVSHSGLILYTVEQLKFQEWKEAAIAYVLLLVEGKSGLTESALDKAAEQMLSSLQLKGQIDFESSDAVAKLKKFGLVNQENDVYIPVPLDDAVKQLNKIWESQSERFDD